MPERNRVTPTGEVVAIALRGAWLGNRGVLHEGHDIVRQYASTAWITCALEFRGWVAPQWEPRRWTALFFADEAVALAAGHRPCALCRRGAYAAYQQAVAAASGEGPLLAPELDARLHEERLVTKARNRRRLVRRTHRLAWPSLPLGAFVVRSDGPALVTASGLMGWSPVGYGTRTPRPEGGDAEVITPPTSLAALAHGYLPQVDPAARAGR